jgi:hypothetical protein
MVAVFCRLLVAVLRVAVRERGGPPVAGATARVNGRITRAPSVSQLWYLMSGSVSAPRY